MRHAFRMKLKPGNVTEYKKRHDEIWPELAKLLRDSGISNYSIYLDEETLHLFAIFDLTDPNHTEQLPHQVQQRRESGDPHERIVIDKQSSGRQRIADRVDPSFTELSGLAIDYLFKARAQLRDRRRVERRPQDRITDTTYAFHVRRQVAALRRFLFLDSVNAHPDTQMVTPADRTT